MATPNQISQLYTKLKAYKKRYLRKQYADLDESATRLMVNSFLIDILGYTELEEVKTEFRIRGEYADYVIQLERKKHFVVEVKAIQLDLTEKHLRQSVNYAANEGIDWIILTNAKQVELYKVLFNKPIEVKKIFSFDLSNEKDLKKAAESLILICKKSVEKKELEHFWKRFQAMEPGPLSKNLYNIDIIRFLKKTLKKKTGLTFSEDDILDSVHQIITTKIESRKPKMPIEPKIKQVVVKKQPEITLKAAQNTIVI